MKDYYVIIGLGMTGRSAIDYFRANQLPIIVMDTREAPPELARVRQAYPDLKIHTGGLDEAVLMQARGILLSPGLAPTHPALQKARRAGIDMFSDIEFFARRLPERAKVVAITGTNGKSTVTSLVGHLASQQNTSVLVGGNLGVPALQLLHQNPDPDIVVLELSSFQLESTYSLVPTASTILNITADHLDRHHTLLAYQQAKQRIYFQAKSAVFNREDALTIPNKSVDMQISFGLDVPPMEMYGIIDNHFAKGFEKLMPASDFPLHGQHNWANALAALALGELIGLDLSRMLDDLKSFKGLTHRCQHIITRAGVAWYNDSKATNVGATKAALEGLSQTVAGKIILIAGGQSKGADFMALKSPIATHVRELILIGECASQLAETFSPVVTIKHADSMGDAVIKAQQAAKQGDAVLLAPACASFDMFNNFEHRGQCFVEAVKSMDAA